MNNQIPFPFNPNIMNNNIQELNMILHELKNINNKLDKLLESKNSKYLEKDDNLYML